MWLMSDQIAQQIRQLTALMEKIQNSWKSQPLSAMKMMDVNQDIINAYQQYNLAYLNMIKSVHTNPSTQVLFTTWMHQLQSMNPEFILRPIINSMEQFRPKNDDLDHSDINFVFNETRRLLEEINKTIKAIMNYQFENLEKLGIDPEMIKITKKHIETMMALTQSQYQKYDESLKKLEDEYTTLLQTQNRDGNYDAMLKTIKENTQLLGQQFDFMLKNINEFLQFKIPSASVVVDAFNNEMFKKPK